MRVNFSYSVDSRIHTFEDWPIQVDGMILIFVREKDRILGVSVECQLSESDALPELNTTRGDNASPHITIPRLSQREAVRAFLRRVQSFMKMFGSCDIDFNSEKIRWVPESQDERDRLSVQEFSFRRENQKEFSVDLTFDFISGIVHGAFRSGDHEIPLSFVRKGRIDLEGRNYFGAFYSFFFYLETKYFPGYSDPKKIKKIICEKDAILKAIETAKRDVGSSKKSRSPEKKYVRMSAAEIVDDLVRTRGNLHHHSIRGPANWHPDKPEEYEAEAVFLGYVVNNLALDEVINQVYFEMDSKSVFAACEAQDAVVSVNFLATEIGKDRGEISHDSHLRIPGKTIHMALIDRLHKEGRKNLGMGSRFISKYEMIDKMNGNVVATYDLNTSYFE